MSVRRLNHMLEIKAGAHIMPGQVWENLESVQPWQGAIAYAVAYGSVFVAVGDSGKCATSPDGTTWTYP